MPSGQGAGTKPIHNKRPKRKVTDEDDEDKAYKAQQKAAEAERKKMAEKASGKGPMNSGQQGIKKSGKK